MTEREALKQALAYLEDYKYAEARTIIREALAQPEQKYTTTRNAWTGKAAHKCNICGRDDFRSEHAAAFHECGEKAQPEQKPMATLDDLEQEIYENTRQFVSRDVMEWMLKRYYTTPPQRTWVGLKEEEIEAIGDIVANEKLVGEVPSFRVRFAQAIEAAHGIKEKNT